MSELARLEQELEELRALPTPRASETFEDMLERLAAEAREVRAMVVPAINVDVAAPVVQSLPAPEVRVSVPDQSAAIVALTEMFGRLVDALVAKEASVTVNVPPVAVTVDPIVLQESESDKVVTFERNPNGSIRRATVTSA